MMNIPCVSELDTGKGYQRYKVDDIVIVIVVHHEASDRIRRRSFLRPRNLIILIVGG